MNITANAHTRQSDIDYAARAVIAAERVVQILAQAHATVSAESGNPARFDTMCAIVRAHNEATTRMIDLTIRRDNLTGI